MSQIEPVRTPMQDEAITYPPLDVPKPVADGVWIVDSGPVRALGFIPVPVRMTVLRLSSGALILHSPTRFLPALHDRLASFGPIEHLVAPNVAHWMFLEAWQERLPGVTTWAAPGLRERGQVQRSRIRIDRELAEEAPAAWSRDIGQVIIPGIGGFSEVALFHRATRTMILTDLVQNLEPAKLPLPLRLLALASGNAAPGGRAPVYLRAAVKLRGAAARRAAGRLVALEPERVVFAHGRWFEENGAARLRRSLAWLL